MQGNSIDIADSLSSHL